MISCRYFDSKDRTDLSFLNTDWEAVVWTIVTNVNLNTNSGKTSTSIRKLSMGQSMIYDKHGVKYKVTVNQGSEYAWVGLEMSKGMGVRVGDQPNMRIRNGKGKIIVFHVENEEGRRLSSQVFYCNNDLSLRSLSLFSVLNSLISDISVDDLELKSLPIPEFMKRELRSIPVVFDTDTEQDNGHPGDGALMSSSKGIILDI